MSGDIAMEIAALVDRIGRDPDCTVFPAAGQPIVDPTGSAPQDVRDFYNLCGGLVIAHGSPYEARIVEPNRCTLANDVILGDCAQLAREKHLQDPSWAWYIIADTEQGNYLAIDFGYATNGQCYDAFWETYAMPGQMAVVATSFTDLLLRLYENRGKRWYWLEPAFHGLGDVYD